MVIKQIKNFRSCSSMAMGTKKDGVVLHSMASRLQMSPTEQLTWLEFISDPKYRASYDFAITHEDDDVIYRLTPEGKFAWHAGKSKFEDREMLNETFFGISFILDGPKNYPELLRAMKKPEIYTDAHYKKANWLLRKLLREYPDIKINRIVRHSDVSNRAVRPDPKFDPGDGFKYTELIENLKKNRAGTL